jgi:hypothetical protein
MKDITIISTAIADYITDNGIAPTQDGLYTSGDAFYLSLSPFYIKVLPLTDQWGTFYNAYCGDDANGLYAISGAAGDDSVIASYGRAGVVEGFTFSAANPEAGLFVVSQSSHFNRDLVMWNGSWIRAPRTVAASA